MADRESASEASSKVQEVAANMQQAAATRKRITGRKAEAPAPEGVHASVGELIRAIPDLRVQVLSTTTAANRCGVHWRLTGTFAGPGTLAGAAPTGRPIDVEGFDLLGIRDGLIQHNDVFIDSMTVARQIGLMPPQGSRAETRMTQAFNAKTRLSAGLGGGEG